MDIRIESNVVRAARALMVRGDDGGVPINRNGQGFNKPDYGAANRILQRYEGGWYSDQDEWALRTILRKYRRQLAEMGLDLENLGTVDEARWAELLPAKKSQAVRPGTYVHFLERTAEPDPFEADTASDDSFDSPARARISLPHMKNILGPDGVIAAALPGYEAREQQIDLSQAIAEAIEAEESIAAEAGTGIGKSIAYLTPSIYSRKKVIVSTEGKALQDQLSRKDLPFLKAALPLNFDFAVLKGMSNYVCKFKLSEEKGQQMLLGISHEFAQVESWLDETESGDLTELSFAPSPDLRTAITTTSDECVGRECPFFHGCYAMRARANAESADVVVVNHTLLCLDLALRVKTDDGVSILPDRDLVVVDEAHALADVATQAFTAEISGWSVHSILRGKLPVKASFDDTLMNEARDAAGRFFATFLRDQRQTFVIVPDPDLELLAVAVRGPLMKLSAQAKAAAGKQERAHEIRQMERYAERLKNLAETFGDVLATAATHVTFVEKTVNGRTGKTTITLKRAPISVAEDLREALWERWPVVATSATITTGGTFAYFREQTGCDEAREITVDSPFDFRKNALLYLPARSDLFDPSKYYQEGSIEYFDRLAGEIQELLLASDGRAFCLFTSRKALNEVYDRIAHRLRWTVLRQGDYGAAEMVRRFREDGKAVLFGLRSFFTGVDIAGDALSLVILDKIPFQAADDPVYTARCDALTRDTGDKWAWFNQLAIPSAVIILKQAAGRLIRTKSDRGVIALLDGRVTSRRYGAGIVRSLPPSTQTRSLDAVRAFFEGAASDEH